MSVSGRSSPRSKAQRPHQITTIDRRQRLGLLLCFAGSLFILRGIGLWPGDVVMAAGTAMAFGLAALWDRSEGSRRRGDARLLLPGGRGERSVGRLVVGGLLLLVGLGLLAGGIDAISGLGTVVLAALVTAAGVTLVLGPWLVGLARDLGRERTERIRQEERAEMTAHLHDSVLQTLALMQRTDDPRRMVTLAGRRSGNCAAGSTRRARRWRVSSWWRLCARPPTG